MYKASKSFTSSKKTHYDTFYKRFHGADTYKICYEITPKLC